MLWLEIPAYAGSTRTSATPTGTAPDHPRIRGEHGWHIIYRWRLTPSSPHTRGARAHRLLKPSGVCIIPAYAGSTTSSPTRWRRPKDHPRIRGEHRQEGRTSGLVWWIIPAYAGSTPLSLSLARGARIIPAYAGSTFPGISATHDTTDHPRIRGEHRGAPAQEGDETGSSPHTRGAPVWRAPADWVPGIIPAYAGSTEKVRMATYSMGDHPRIRGEHAAFLAKVKALAGSSPHTRGARRQPPR